MKIYDKIAALSPTGLVKKTITVAFLGDSVTQGCFEVYKKSENEIETVYDAKCAYSVKFKEFLNFLYPDMIIHIINAGGGYLNPKTERREGACSFRFLCCELYK